MINKKVFICCPDFLGADSFGNIILVNKFVNKTSKFVNLSLNFIFTLVMEKLAYLFDQYMINGIVISGVIEDGGQ